VQTVYCSAVQCSTVSTVERLTQLNPKQNYQIRKALDKYMFSVCIADRVADFGSDIRLDLPLHTHICIHVTPSLRSSSSRLLFTPSLLFLFTPSLHPSLHPFSLLLLFSSHLGLLVLLIKTSSGSTELYVTRASSPSRGERLLERGRSCRCI
jgi:hypothetical protein